MKFGPWRALFILLALVVGFASTQTWESEELNLWFKDKVATYSKKNLPLAVTLERVEFCLIPFRLTAHELSLQPQGTLKAILQPLTVNTLSVTPSLFHLLIGQIHIAKIDAGGAQVHVNYEIKDSEKEQKIELEKILQQIPVTQLELTDVKILANLKYQSQDFQIQIGNTKTIVTNDLNNLLVRLNLEKLKFKYNEREILSNTFFETHFFLTEKNLVLSDFKVKEKDSFVVASGSTQHSLKNKKIQSGKLNIRAFMKADHAKSLYSALNPVTGKSPLEPISGSVKTDLRFDIKDLQRFDVSTKTLLYSLQYENFKIGDIDIAGNFSNETQKINIDSIQVKNSGLKAEIGSSQFSVKDLSFVDVPLSIQSLSLNPFLKFAIAKDVPAHIDVKGSTLCRGALDPFKIDCEGELLGDHIKVNPKVDRPIIELKTPARIKGQFSITAKEVSYQATADLTHSKGESQGVINYQNGFQINYSTDALDLSAIEKISGLDIAGKAKIHGMTSGNSESAIFDLQFEGRNVDFEKYKLGDVSQQMRYSKGTLSVLKIQGSASSSRYLGNLAIQLDKDLISGKIQFPFIDLAVTQESIKSNLDIPVSVSGSGAAVIQIDGPLDPKRLSFKAKARLYNCKIDQQHIENADIDLTSELGQVRINSATLEEKNSSGQISGLLSLERREYDLAFQSQKMYLDDIIYTTKYSTPAKGLFSLKGRVKGPFNNPNLDFDFISENFQLANKKIAPIKGQVAVYGNKTVAEVFGPNDLKFIFRNIHNLPDYHIEGTTKNFDVAALLTSFLEIKHVDDFKILLTSNFNLKVPRQNPQNISGYLFLPKIEIDTEKNRIASSQEISLFFTNGKVNFSAFELLGNGGQIKVKSNPTTYPIDVQLSGLFSLSFAHIFTPFLETIEGQTTVNFRVQKREKALEFFGSAFIDNGYIKLPDIQHAVENLKVDLLFNQDRVNINSMKGKFASGQLLGDGSIRLIGAKNLPLDLNLHLDNVDLNIPPQVNTIGSADLKLTGQWLPFQLSGSYHVIDGLITKEISSDDSNKVNAHEIFLPQSLRNEVVSPIELNLDIIPNTPIKIKNSMIDGKVQGQIRVTGSPQSPTLAGQASLTKFTQIIFRDVTFRVRDSNIQLTGTNPPNPNLYILADSRYKGYDIEMLIQGNAEKPKFTLTSQPTLSQPEIISLLALGYTTNEITSANANNPNNPNNQSNVNGTNSPGNNQALQVGTGVFGQNPLGKEFKNRFGVDVQFSSRFDSNSSVAVPTIGFSKRISERTSFVGSVQTGKDSRADGKLRYELDRGFAATMSVQSQAREEANQIRGNNLSDILGIDLEFRKEFK